MDAMNMAVMRGRMAGTAAAIALLFTGAPSMAIEGIEPNARDYTPVPVGKSLIATYTDFVWSDGLYAEGEKAPLDVDANAQIGAIRYVYSTKLFGMTINPEFIVPFYRAGAQFVANVPGFGRVPVLDENKGFFGDVILAASVWLVENPGTKSWAAITPWVILPTGEYSPRNHSVSQIAAANRWQFLPQLGFVQGITDKLYIEGSADVSYFGGNEDFPGMGLAIPPGTLDRDPVYTARGILSYDLTPQDIVAVTLRYSWGGKTSVDGVKVNGELDDLRLTFQYQKWLTDTRQVSVEYLHDVKVENGLALDQALVRTLSLF